MWHDWCYFPDIEGLFVFLFTLLTLKCNSADFVISFSGYGRPKTCISRRCQWIICWLPYCIMMIKGAPQVFIAYHVTSFSFCRQIVSLLMILIVETFFTEFLTCSFFCPVLKLLSWCISEEPSYIYLVMIHICVAASGCMLNADGLS